MPDEPFSATVVISAGGPAGPAGTAATVEVGSTTTSSPGSNAVVLNSGTDSAAVLEFTIPRGATGATGLTGPAGPAGAGSGDVLGPGVPVVNNRVVFWDGTTGTAIKDSGLTLAGTNTGDQTVTLTGNVTGSGTGSFAATIANDAVTYAKMQNVSTTDRLLGRSTAGSGDVEEIVCTSAGRAILDDSTASDQRTTLGLAIGTNVQAWDAQLDALAGLAYAGNSLKVIRVNTGETGFEFFSPSATVAWGAVTGTLSDQTDLQAALDALQPLDSDLTTIAGLTATTDNFIVSVASAWASRTPAQVRTTLGLVIGTDVQAFDADLSTWAGVTPGTGVATALAVNVGSAGAFVTFNGALGTPSSGTLTNCTGLPIAGLTASTSTALGVGTIELGAASDTTIARSGAGAITVEGVQVLLSGAALGTPSSGTLTNCTGLPVAGITASTSTALGVGSIELGHASDTTITRTGAGAIAVEGTAVLLSGGTLGTPSSATLTNATGLPVSGITASTSTALGVGSIELGHASDTTIARSGAGAITVEGVQVILSGAALGTPASGTLTNCSALPVSGITASTSTALGVGSIELGAASDTTIARASAGRITVEGVPVTTSAPRVTTISSNATWAPNADTDDIYEITAQAVDATTISNPSGTPVNGQKLIMRMTGTAARALTWSGSKWRASSDLALPTTTTTTKSMYLGFMYNTAGTGTWDLLAKLDNF